MNAKAMIGLIFNGAQIRVPKAGSSADSPDVPGSWLVATLHTDALSDAREYAATGIAMAASGEMLAALQAVAEKLGSRPYGTGSYLPKPLRDQVLAAVAKGSGQGGDPCPSCQPGLICKKPSCGRLTKQTTGSFHKGGADEQRN